jgi:prophage regulatory protein
MQPEEGTTEEPTMRLLDRESLAAKGIKFSRAQLYRLVNAGDFPKPVKIGANKNCWVEAEIDTYIEKKIAERDNNVKAV